MSFTDGMDKTPGRRQHNRGWSRLVRQQRREEAVARNKACQDRGCIPLWMVNPGGRAEQNLLREIFSA